MKLSESIKNLSKALLKAQAAMGGAVKGAKNPFFKSSYSDYNSVLEVVKEPLNDAGIILLQPTIVRDGKTLVETTVIHAESGEFISGEMEVVCAKQNDPQAYGSAITYARRYSLQSMLSIPSVDDDSESAMSRQPKQEAPKAAVKPPMPAERLSATTVAAPAKPVEAPKVAAPVAPATNTKPSSFKAPATKPVEAKPAAAKQLDWS